MSKKERSIYIASVPKYLTKDDLMSYFIKFGRILFLNLKVYKKKDKISCSFTVECHQSYKDILHIKEHVVKGAKLIAEHKISRDELIQLDKEIVQKKVYIKNIPLDFKDEDLKQCFIKFGSIESAVINKRDDIKIQEDNYGFVTFAEIKIAQAVIAMERIILHEKEGLVLCVKPLIKKQIFLTKKEINLKRKLRKKNKIILENKRKENLYRSQAGWNKSFNQRNEKHYQEFSYSKNLKMQKRLQENNYNSKQKSLFIKKNGGPRAWTRAERNQHSFNLNNQCNQYLHNQNQQPQQRFLLGTPPIIFPFNTLVNDLSPNGADRKMPPSLKISLGSPGIHFKTNTNHFVSNLRFNRK